MSDPKNYRGITVTPVVGKVLELLIRDMIRPILDRSQAQLQRWFTPNCSPAHTALILQELLADGKDKHERMYVAFLDAKTAFDVVSHDSLLRKLYHNGITGDLWLLLHNLHQHATTSVKWKGLTYDPFPIHQGVRQGGILSTDLYKAYNNDLIKQLQYSPHGVAIGNIPCGAPTCADDVTLAASSEMNLKVLLNISTTYSNMERYELQPSKSLVLPCFQDKDLQKDTSLSWHINNSPMPVVEIADHLGMKRDPNNLGLSATVENNIQKARKALYALMGAGLHGRNGLIPHVSFHIYEIYVLPILLYGLEVLLPDGKPLQALELFHKKTLKELLSLPTSLADLLGAQPIIYLIHKKALTLLGSIVRSPNSIDYNLAKRQTLLHSNKHSWFVKMSDILAQYDLPPIRLLLESPLSKCQWSTQVRKAIHVCCTNTIVTQACLYSSLRYINTKPYQTGKEHPSWATIPPTPSATRKAIIKTRLLTGTCSLRSNRQAFNQYTVDKSCLLCHSAPETRCHFLLECPSLDSLRAPFLQQLKQCANRDLAPDELLQCILDPSVVLPGKPNNTAYHEAERISRDLCHILHTHRQRFIMSLQQ